MFYALCERELREQIWNKKGTMKATDNTRRMTLPLLTLPKKCQHF